MRTSILKRVNYGVTSGVLAFAMVIGFSPPVSAEGCATTPTVTVSEPRTAMAGESLVHIVSVTNNNDYDCGASGFLLEPSYVPEGWYIDEIPHRIIDGFQRVNF